MRSEKSGMTVFTGPLQNNIWDDEAIQTQSMGIASEWISTGEQLVIIIWPKWQLLN